MQLCLSLININRPLHDLASPEEVVVTHVHDIVLNVSHLFHDKDTSNILYYHIQVIVEL